MKKVTLKSALFAGLVSLMLCFSACGNSSSLTDITKPYLGEYECQSATYGDKERLEDFTYIRLELKQDETFVLSYCPQDGEKHMQTGKYVYDKERKTVRLSMGERGEMSREFPCEKGEILVSLQIGGRTLNVKFKQR